MGSYRATPDPLETRMDKGFAKVAETFVAHLCGTLWAAMTAIVLILGKHFVVV